jgi:hypothetical protein
MVVKIKKKIDVMGEEREITHYLPEDVPLTRDRREKADRLDEELKKIVNEINKQYEKLDGGIKNNELNKWKWLGREIDKTFKSVKNLDQIDVDNDSIWPAIGQYFRKELKRGFDARRSGTKKDHCRKCWLLATLPDLDWINSWSGWDAFVDRGEQLVMSKKIMPILKERFSRIVLDLKPRDYQKIAKKITESIPSGTDAPTDIDSMSNEEITKIVDCVYEEFIASNE